jgi:hypothetical protein
MRALLCLVMLLLLGAPAAAQELDRGDRRDIQDVIDRQIAAFKRDDGKEAFGYATPDLQAQFGDVQTFMRMVRAGYGPVYRPRIYQFRELKEMNGVVTQQVYVVGPDNIPRLALYFMQQQKDGTWRISGCVLVDFDGDQA